MSDYSSEANPSTLAAPDYIITASADNGSQAAGTLSKALASATSGKSILITVPNITISGTGLPPVQPGVTIAGSCGVGGPGVTLNGSGTVQNTPGLVLQGGEISLFGIKVIGFRGVQIKANNSPNLFKCVVAKTTQ
jgi:hypothetical protein